MSDEPARSTDEHCNSLSKTVLLRLLLLATADATRNNSYVDFAQLLQYIADLSAQFTGRCYNERQRAIRSLYGWLNRHQTMDYRKEIG